MNANARESGYNPDAPSRTANFSGGLLARAAAQTLADAPGKK